MATTSYQTFRASGQQFEISSKYSLIRPIGHGAYGVVISALDKETNQKVAIKKITRAFEDPIDAKRILREIKLMKAFAHENVIQIIDIIPPPSTAEEFEDVYIVQDLMETDLHRIIYSKQPLTIDHIQYFVYQILRGLKYIHSANVLHRDLKPSNLLLRSNCDLKICDFGLSRGVEDEQTGGLTEYVVTRWYRAPEIMLACQEYTSAIDIWSVGCIFAELLARSPLFPGDDYIAQLRLICEKIGRPSEKDLDFVTSDRAKRFIASLPANKPTPFSHVFANHRDEHDALDLLKQMLEIHPKRRATIEQALEHPFLESLHNSDDEPVTEEIFSFEFENEDLTRERIQQLIWEEIREYHPEIPETYPSLSSPSRRKVKHSSPFERDDSKDAKTGGSSSSQTDDKDVASDEETAQAKASKKRSIIPEDKDK
jgi:mitogen-activated protein kinase 1/3